LVLAPDTSGILKSFTCYELRKPVSQISKILFKQAYPYSNLLIGANSFLSNPSKQLPDSLLELF
jgi:hypothetical protein